MENSPPFRFNDATPITQPFLAWEKLRIYYNLILLAVALGMTSIRPEMFVDPYYWITMALAAAGANVCFCAGPVAENYLALLGAHRGVSRSVLFGLGCLFACALAVLYMAVTLLGRDRKSVV